MESAGPVHRFNMLTTAMVNPYEMRDPTSHRDSLKGLKELENIAKTHSEEIDHKAFGYVYIFYHLEKGNSKL